MRVESKGRRAQSPSGEWSLGENTAIRIDYRYEMTATPGKSTLVAYDSKKIGVRPGDREIVAQNRY